MLTKLTRRLQEVIFIQESALASQKKNKSRNFYKGVVN